MTWPKRAAMTIMMIAAVAVVAGANQWNDRTTFKFDTPIMVPGKTLAPGTYTFRVVDGTQHMVQIVNENGDLITTTHTVPIKRMDSKGDTVIKLSPTEVGAPVALKAWYYPGTLYGHQFVYADQQARDIAQRTKTLVLSGDIPDSDMEKATLYLYDERGGKQPWRSDAQTVKEWREWTRSHATATAKMAAPGTENTRESTAPAMRTQPAGTTVKISDLEENPNRYIGQAINVTAEVDDVLGPRLFKIDEPNWGDLDGEVLVYMPTDLVALIREEDRVTVTGTMKMFGKVDFDRELEWLEPEPDLDIEFASRAVLVASDIVGGNSNTALAIRLNPSGAVGTSGATTSARLTDAAAIARGDGDLVGRHVDLTGVKVQRLAKKHGFWIEAGGASLFVLPAQHAAKSTTPATGQTVSLQGMVLEMPKSMRDKARQVANAETDVYIYATTLK